MGGQMKNKIKQERCKIWRNRRGFGTVKQLVFGHSLSRQVGLGRNCPWHWSSRPRTFDWKIGQERCYCLFRWLASLHRLAAKGYVHRLVDNSKHEYSDGKGNHINGLEGFWGYLKKKLAAKGGIRRERLLLYLGEYVWRFNNRKLLFKRARKFYLPC